MSNVKTNKFGGALLFILGEFASAEEEMIEDGGMEVFGEDDQGREGSCEVSINDLAQAASHEINHLTDQLAKANQRAEQTLQDLLHHKNVNRDIHLKNSGIATLVSELTGNSVVLPKMKTRGEIKSALKKFAIEQQIEGLKDYQALCGFADCRKSIDARIAQLEEQLRKEQEHG